MNKYFKRSSSQVLRDNARNSPNHRMMIAAMKKEMIVLPARFARSTGWNCRRNMEFGFNAIYAMNISAQSAMTRESYFFVVFASDHNY